MKADLKVKNVGSKRPNGSLLPIRDVTNRVELTAVKLTVKMIQPAALVCLSTLLAHVCLCRARPTLGCAPWMPLVFALSTLTLLATTIFLAISGFNAHTLPSSLPALSQPLPTFLSLSSPASFIFVGILSHPANHARRAAYRASCIPALDAARVPYKFFVGRPSQDTGVISKSQGRHGTPAEIAEARALLNETRAFGDVEIGTAREHYRDLTDKVSALRIGFDALVSGTNRLSH